MKNPIGQTSITLLLAACSLSAATHYVSLSSTNPTPPYDTWATAATNIQDAVDAASVPGAVVLVSNGLYAVGARLYGDTGSSRVVVDKPVILQSVSGPEETVIDGGGAVRCIYLGAGSMLTGFTLTNGNVDRFVAGGGIYCHSSSVTVSNCIVVDNFAFGGAGVHRGTLSHCRLIRNKGVFGGGGADYAVLNECELISNWCQGGGGALSCTLNNCVLVGNGAGEHGGGGAEGSTLNACVLRGNSARVGGGVLDCTLNNCTLVGNSAEMGWGGAAFTSRLNNCTLVGNVARHADGKGGGAYSCTLKNSIIYYNYSAVASNYGDSTLDYCCTTPVPTNGVGNIDPEPLFVDIAGGNLHLQPDSPCINAGNNAFVTNSTDLGGNPRLSGGIVDMGAYEFVFTPSMEVAQLIQLVNDSDLGAKNKQPLLTTLSAALASLERGNLNSGVNQLRAFQNKLRAQVAPVDAALAEQLINTVQDIIERMTNP